MLKRYNDRQGEWGVGKLNRSIRNDAIKRMLERQESGEDRKPLRKRREGAKNVNK